MTDIQPQATIPEIKVAFAIVFCALIPKSRTAFTTKIPKRSPASPSIVLYPSRIPTTKDSAAPT